ncbi:Golgin subfamily A member 7/ERF4 family-domain-containing protein [Halteromyces radiatus]|uniref:Golgin subfamily A member 7/ERF4 family-domain-containing protein n=1 Tax=Halteromyces radiatus TaxID=101107 RepID=UPI0022210A05|nr:Golgin subfamily A member 7/ERF4 family-domain-containing protein [Halteromyces radiatus]KAI8098709.1 Golgin subfamily A member 7/ERF4 family-domain-containing protein [Halteromyces radiatus]
METSKYHHHQRRYTDTCLYLTPPSPLYAIQSTKSRFSCTAAPTYHPLGHHQPTVSLDSSDSFVQQINHHKKRYSLSDTLTPLDGFNTNEGSTIDVTDCSDKQQHQQRHAMATTTTTTVTKSTGLTNKSHTSIDITHQVPTKTVRIERDYSKGDGITQFCTELPLALEGKITSEQFSHTINTINALLNSAERLTWSGVFYNMMEIATIYLWPIFFNSHYQKTIHKLLKFIEQENHQVYHQQRLSIRNPVKTAFLFVSI